MSCEFYLIFFYKKQGEVRTEPPPQYAPHPCSTDVEVPLLLLLPLLLLTVQGAPGRGPLPSDLTDTSPWRPGFVWGAGQGHLLLVRVEWGPLEQTVQSGSRVMSLLVKRGGASTAGRPHRLPGRQPRPTPRRTHNQLFSAGSPADQSFPASRILLPQSEPSQGVSRPAFPLGSRASSLGAEPASCSHVP